VQRGIMMKGEYFLTDTISLMIEHGAKVRTNEISTWIDTGTIEATLDTNKILLDQGRANKTINETDHDVKIIAPSFIDPSAEIRHSVIGPYASIGANCQITNSQITESILEGGCEIQDAVLNRSLIGTQAKVRGRGDGHVIQLNVGDHSAILLS
jgi:glucose-1-phosphate thymidylyltransferase